MTSRVVITNRAMTRAAVFGLDKCADKLSQLLKRMVRSSAIASGNFNEQRRRYGSFILTMRGKSLVDINCTEEIICIDCLGIGLDDSGEVCHCSIEEMLHD